MTDSTVVILLGTGTPVPEPQASGPSTAVIVGERIFVIDAGPGTMRRMTASGLPRNKLTALFLTHLHSDHTLGYPDLIFTTWTVGRRVPFDVYGPPGTKRMTDHLMEAWSEDRQIRVDGLERNSAGGYAVHVREIGAGKVYDSAGVTVTAFRVKHGNWEYAFGFRFDTPGKSVVISGDTSPSEELTTISRNADILLHEVYAGSRAVPENRPGGELWPQYLREFHTSDQEVGEIARRSGVKTLILHHILRMGGTDIELIEGVRRGGYEGWVVVGKDLDRF